MDHGNERDTPPGRPAGPGALPDDPVADPLAGRVPLAVVVVDRDGLVSHWSRGARRLFGLPREEAIGRPASDLLPVSGVVPDADADAGAEDDDTDAFHSYDAYAADDGLGPGLESSLDGRLSYPAAGRARLTAPTRHRVDVLWWAYPLVGPGPERLLVLAADADGLRRDRADGGAATATVERIAPGFALHTDFPGADELARRLPEILPSTSVGESARIVAQVLELGYPVLEFSQNDRVPVTPDWGVPRRADRRARRERA
ncbi:PAS domain-containing protein, partial [Streptomyces olivaceus]|uniref:PAS domain-containing protein n=1 Tax=Streptomyces olivaceus TaxID=47716 RepID=UPI0040569467